MLDGTTEERCGFAPSTSRFSSNQIAVHIYYGQIFRVTDKIGCGSFRRRARAPGNAENLRWFTIFTAASLGLSFVVYFIKVGYEPTGQGSEVQYEMIQWACKSVIAKETIIAASLSDHVHQFPEKISASNNHG